jgi:hypothetical protein
VLLAMQNGNLKLLKEVFYITTRSNTSGAYESQLHPSMVNFEWSEVDLEHAARKGSTECVAFAIEHGCPWDPKVCGSKLGKSVGGMSNIFFLAFFSEECSQARGKE